MGEVFAKTFNPVERMKAKLIEASGLNVEIATESDGTLYYVGLVRKMREGTLLHVDYAAHDAPGYKVSQVDAQIAWNLFLCTGEGGGECEVFNQQWDSCHRVYELQNSYGYDPSVVRGARSHIIEPVVGDVVLFNCRNFHQVAATRGERVTIGSFVGRLNSGLVMWS
jgi:hypothetical protein